MRTTLPALLVVALIATVGWAADPTPREVGDAAIAARAVFMTHCQDCHSEAKSKTKHGRVRVDDFNALTGNIDEPPPIDFVRLNSEGRSQVIDFMKDGSMPPGGRPPVSEKEIALVEKWIGLKAIDKEYPIDFEEKTVLQMIVDDNKKRPDPARVRYVSFAHLTDKSGAVDAAEKELTAALAKLTPKAELTLTPVNGSAATLFRLDLDAVGWGKGERFLFERIEGGWEDKGEFRMIPFDLIQLEYPYTHTPPDELKEAVNKAVVAMNAHRKSIVDKNSPLGQLRAVPFVRGDWLAKALMKGDKPTPLGEELKSLAQLATDLPPEDARMGTGPDYRPFEGEAGPDDPKGVPMWAWYRGNVTPAPVPFKFEPTAGGIKPFDQNKGITLSAKVDPARPLVVSLVEVQSDRVKVHKIDTNQKQPFLVMEKNGPISPNETEVFKPSISIDQAGKPLFVLLFVSAKGSAHKEPVVVRSRHEKQPVWRVLPNPDDAGENGRPPVLRAVIRVDTPPKK